MAQDLDKVYSAYDPQNTGKIDYRNFIENFLFSPNDDDSQSSQMNKSQVSQKSQQKSPIAESRAHTEK